MIFKPSITKEEINELPLCTFTGKIVVVDTQEKLIEAITDLKKEIILGFDTETRPSFAKGVLHTVSLMQIATNDTCYLFRLNLLDLNGELKNLLKDKNILKIGISLHDDFISLNRRKPAFKPEGFIDIQKIIKNYGIEDLSLQKIYAILFGEKISKSQRLTNWEADKLTKAQQQYAAIDAWAARRIYLFLQEIDGNPLA